MTDKINKLVKMVMDTEEYEPPKISTGIAMFDSIIGGGVPLGSAILLLGEIGAGQNEFAYTSAVRLSKIKSNKKWKEYLSSGIFKGTVIPDKVCYLSLSKSKIDVMQQIRHAFTEDVYKEINDKMIFKDLSSIYFQRSIVPKSWSSETVDILDKEENLLKAFIDFLNENAPNSLVIIDSLTDLVINESIHFGDIISVLKGIRRMSKQWNGLIYVILSTNVLDPKKQLVVEDSVDAVFVFEWRALGSTKRKKIMYIKKFGGLMPQLDDDNIAKFETRITAKGGFMVTNYERMR